ncbi:MAG TPA: hypothetical protein VG406_02885, partial [Isosphaeraceae bacterium]|nr:hypothetical protein [Isosphaeraceae bacterium]
MDDRRARHLRLVDDDDSGLLSGGEIGYDVPGEVDGQELPMIETFQGDTGPFRRLRAAGTAPPRPNGSQEGLEEGHRAIVLSLPGRLA